MVGLNRIWALLVPCRPLADKNGTHHAFLRGLKLNSLFLSVLMLCVSCEGALSPSQVDVERLTNAVWDNLYSAEGASLVAIESLLEAGADPNLRTSENDDYLLEWAAKKNGDELMLLLLKHGADPNLHEEEVSPLHWACASSGKDRFVMVKTLVEHGADVDHRDNVRSTPLHWAASGRFDCVGYLLECGADTNVKNRAGKTSLDVAKKYSDIYGVDSRYGETIYEYMLRRVQGD